MDALSLKFLRRLRLRKQENGKKLTIEEYVQEGCRHSIIVYF